MSLCRKRIYSSFLVLILILSGCSGKVKEKLWTSDDCEAIDVSCLEGETPYAEVGECVLPFGRDVVGSYCLYDFKVYYEVNYWNTLIDQTGMTPNKEFSEEHNTQIRCYDMVNQTDKLVYRYDSTKCEDVIDIECNGTYLIWENYDNDGWELNSIRLQDNSSSEPNVAADLSEGELYFVCFALQDNCAFWYDYEDKKMNLYSCNLDTGETKLIYEGSTLTSPYEQPCIAGDNILLYQMNEEEVTKVFSIDKKNRQKLHVQIRSEIADIVGDSEYYAWRKNYNSGENEELYYYDVVQEQYRKIKCGNFFSYALQDNYLILNLQQKDKWNGAGVYCIDLNEYQAYYISGTDATTLWTNAGPNNVYWQEVDDTSNFKIKNMVFK